MKPSRIFLTGPMGCGKTRVGRMLAKCLACEFCDSDKLIAQHAGSSIAAIFETEGEAGFRRRETQVLRELAGRRKAVIATGGGAVLDDDNRKLLKENGTVVYLCATPEVRIARLEKSRNKRPLLAGGDLRGTIVKLDRERNALYEAVADLTVANDGEPDDAVNAIIMLMEMEK